MTEFLYEYSYCASYVLGRIIHLFLPGFIIVVTLCFLRFEFKLINLFTPASTCCVLVAFVPLQTEDFYFPSSLFNTQKFNHEKKLVVLENKVSNI